MIRDIKIIKKREKKEERNNKIKNIFIKKQPGYVYDRFQ